MSESAEQPAASRAQFPMTRWSLVVAAGGEAAGAGAALEDLCRAYWAPIYAECRRRGQSPADAQDSTQEFFARLLRRQSFGAADREKGRFRSFLLGALGFFLTDQWRSNRAEKRGGGASVLSLDAEECEAWYRQQPAAGANAAEAFDQRWALILMDRALEALRADYVESGRGQTFEAVKPFLAAETGGEGYEDVCAGAGMTPEAFSVAVHRLRKRFRACLREQVSMTVADPSDVEAEMRHLFG